MLQLDNYVPLMNKVDNFKVGQFLYCQNNSTRKNLVSSKIHLPETIIVCIQSICKGEEINLLAFLSVAVRSVFYEILETENLGLIICEAEKHLFVRKFHDKTKTFKELLIDNKNTLMGSIKTNTCLNYNAKEQIKTFSFDDHVILSIDKEFSKDVFRDLQNFIYISLNTAKNNMTFTFTKNTYDGDRVNKLIILIKKYINNVTATRESLANYSSIILEQFDDKKSLLEGESYHGNFLRLEKLFECKVHEYSEKPCLVVNGLEYTYYQLNKDSDILAKRISVIASPKEVIGVHLNKSYTLFVTILGIMKAGCAYVPLDIAWPTSRKKYIAEDSKMSFIITDCYIDIQCQTIDVGKLTSSTREFEDFKLFNHELNSYSYFIYTSGTTGTPKKVGIYHYQIFNTINFRCKYYKYDDSRVSIQLLPFFFDGFVTSFFTPICTGAKLVIPEDGDLYNLNNLISLMNEHKVTDLITIPSYFEQIMKIVKPSDLEFLNNVVVAGEKVSSNFMELLKESKLNINLFNEYGLTETSVLCSVKKIFKNDYINNIGTPIVNTSITVRNKNGKILPQGFIGEIVVEGIGVICDNNSRSNRTIKVMNYNFPVSSYNTGDYGYINDNNLYYCFRKDNQLKVSGIRIDLSEINSQIKNLRYVKDAAIISENGIVEAYIVLVDKCSEHEYHRKIRNSIPTYMIPNKTYFVKKIERGISGKINLDFLKKERKENEQVRLIILPRNETQKIIINIWKHVLSIDKISITDNYFELGGNSLNIIKLIVMLNKANLYNFEIKVMDIFEYPTIESLTTMLSHR